MKNQELIQLGMMYSFEKYYFYLFPSLEKLKNAVKFRTDTGTSDLEEARISHQTKRFMIFNLECSIGIIEPDETFMIVDIGEGINSYSISLKLLGKDKIGWISVDSESCKRFLIKLNEN